MAFTAAYLNLMRKMYMIRMELMMRLMRPGELKEQDLLSRFGNSEGDANIDYYPTPIPPQIGDNHNHGLVSTRGVGAFRPWGISNNSDHVSPNNNNNSTINTGFIDFIGTTPVLASLPPPHPTIPIFSAQLNGHTLSLAPATQTIDDHMIPMSSSKPFKRAEVADQKPPRLDHPDGYQNGKTCTKCKRNNTPLWRNGPHGPKTLCNACGIRFRKKEKKAALGITDQQEFLKPRNGIRKPN